MGPGSDCETCGWSPDDITIEADGAEWTFSHTFGCYGGHGGSGDLAALTAFLNDYPTIKQEVLEWAAAPPSNPLSTEQVRALAGHASIGEPVWETEPREAIPELEPDYQLSPAERAGWAIIDHLPDDQRVKLLALIDTDQV